MLEVGQRVTWNVNTFKMVGVVLEDMGITVDIVSHLKGSTPHVQKMNVEKKLLTKI